MTDQEVAQLIPELRPFADEVEAALQRRDNAALREIIERCGLGWIDPALPDRYRTGKSCEGRET